MSKNGILPKSKIEAIRFNRYRGDHYGSFHWIDYWPRRLAQAVISGTLGDKTILGLFAFLIGNGMQPDAAKMLVCKEVNGDPTLCNKVKWLHKGVTEGYNFGTYWDIDTQSTMNVKDSIIPATYYKKKKAEPQYIPAREKYVPYKKGDYNRTKQSDLDDDYEDLIDEDLEPYYPVRPNQVSRYTRPANRPRAASAPRGYGQNNVDRWIAEDEQRAAGQVPQRRVSEYIRNGKIAHDLYEFRGPAQQLPLNLEDGIVPYKPLVNDSVRRIASKSIYNRNVVKPDAKKSERDLEDEELNPFFDQKFDDEYHGR
ncbi:hypothetical protein [Northern red-backed vole stool-associated circular virus 68]|nr:hypothetical protein [Northern red-backed vole stool-associated circular virus 68]